MDAVAILGVILGVFSLVLSIYNTILLKVELLSRARPATRDFDIIDKGRALYPGAQIPMDEDGNFDAPWERPAQDEMEDLLR